MELKNLCILFLLSVALLVTSCIVGSCREIEDAHKESKGPPKIVILDQELKKTTAPSGLEHMTKSDRLVAMARKAARKRGYPEDKAVEIYVSRLGQSWQIEFLIEKLKPKMLGGKGFYVLLKYPSGEFEDIGGIQ